MGLQLRMEKTNQLLTSFFEKNSFFFQNTCFSNCFVEHFFFSSDFVFCAYKQTTYLFDVEFEEFLYVTIRTFAILFSLHLFEKALWFKCTNFPHFYSHTAWSKLIKCLENVTRCQLYVIFLQLGKSIILKFFSH